MSVSFFIVGVGLLAAAGVFLWRTKAFIAESVSTPGRVVELEYQTGLGAHSSGGFVTIFTFADAAGYPHTNRTASAQTPATHQVGESVTVLYLANHTDTAQIRGFRTLWIVPTFLGGFGIAFTCIGLIALVAVRKTYAQHTQLRTAS